MTDEAAFLAAIAAAPDDLAPRLVFADWLDERDDPRGGWLRDPELAAVMGVRCENPIPVLIRRLDGHREDLDRDCQLLLRIGRPAVEPLIDALRAVYVQGLRHILSTLRLMSDHLEEVRPRLEADLESPDADARRAAVRALGCLDESAALAGLRRRLSDPDADTRLRALADVAGLRSGAKALVPVMLQGCRDEVDRRDGTKYREAAIAALGEMCAGNDAEAAVIPFLVRCLGHPTLTRPARDSLGMFTDAVAGPLLEVMPMLDPTGARVAAECYVEATSVYGEPHYLLDVWENPATHPISLRALLTAHAATGPQHDAYEPALRRLMLHDDPSVAIAAVRTARRHDRFPSAVEDVSRAFRSDTAAVRIAALEVLAEIDPKHDATGKVLRRGFTDPAEAVRVAAFNAYLHPSTTDENGHETPPPLLPTDYVRGHRRLLDDDDKDVRLIAVEALGRVLVHQPERHPSKSVLAWLETPIFDAKRNAAAILVGALDDRSRSVRQAVTALLAEHLPQESTDAFDPLVDALDDADPAVRMNAARALSRLEMASDPAIRKCLRLLGDDDPKVIAAALQSLGVMRKDRPDIDRKIVPFLRDRLPRLRAAAARALSMWDGPEQALIDDALDLAGEEDHRVRAAGLRMLASFHPDVSGKHLAKHVRRGLRDESELVRACAIDALAGRDAEFLRPMRAEIVQAMVTEADDDRGDELAAKLRQNFPDRVEFLMPLLDDPSPKVRARTLTALAGLGEAAGPLVPRLVAEWGRNVPETRRAVVAALHGVGAEAAPAVPLLRGIALGHDAALYASAMEVIGTLREAGASFVPLLLEGAGDPAVAESQRSPRYRLLGQLAPWCPDAVPPLRLVLADPSSPFVVQVLGAIQRVGPPGAVFLPEVIGLLPHAATRGLAAEALAAMGEVAAPAVPALVDVLRGEREPSRQAKAIKALGAIGPAASPAVTVLVDLVPSHGPAAMQALGRVGSADALPAIRRSLRHDDGLVREAAAEALVAFGPTAAPALPDICKHVLDVKWDTIEDVLTQAGMDRRMYLLDAIEKIGSTADPVLPTLRKLLDDPKYVIAYRTVEVAATLRATEILKHALKHRDESIREEAKQGLAT